jgi:hypothetical protein
MRDTAPTYPVYVISAERPRRSTQQNAASTRKLRALLTTGGFAHFPARGYWEGKHEASTVVVAVVDPKEVRRMIDNLALTFDQDAVLYVSESRRARLLQYKGRKPASLALGTLKSSNVHPGTAAYTYVPSLRTWYYVGKPWKRD